MIPALDYHFIFVGWFRKLVAEMPVKLSDISQKLVKKSKTSNSGLVEKIQ